MLRVTSRPAVLAAIVLVLAVPAAWSAPAGLASGADGASTPSDVTLALGTPGPYNESYRCQGDAPFDACFAGPFKLKRLEIAVRPWGFVGTIHASAVHVLSDKVLARLSCEIHGVWVATTGPVASSCSAWQADPFPAGSYAFQVDYERPTVGSFDVTFRYG